MRCKLKYVLMNYYKMIDLSKLSTKHLRFNTMDVISLLFLYKLNHSDNLELRQYITFCIKYQIVIKIHTPC